MAILFYFPSLPPFYGFYPNHPGSIMVHPFLGFGRSLGRSLASLGPGENEGGRRAIAIPNLELIKCILDFPF